MCYQCSNVSVSLKCSHITIYSLQCISEDIFSWSWWLVTTDHVFIFSSFDITFNPNFMVLNIIQLVHHATLTHLKDKHNGTYSPTSTRKWSGYFLTYCYWCMSEILKCLLDVSSISCARMTLLGYGIFAV